MFHLRFSMVFSVNETCKRKCARSVRAQHLCICIRLVSANKSCQKVVKTDFQFQNPCAAVLIGDRQMLPWQMKRIIIILECVPENIDEPIELFDKSFGIAVSADDHYQSRPHGFYMANQIKAIRIGWFHRPMHRRGRHTDRPCFQSRPGCSDGSAAHIPSRKSGICRSITFQGMVSFGITA